MTNRFGPVFGVLVALVAMSGVSSSYADGRPHIHAHATSGRFVVEGQTANGRASHPGSEATASHIPSSRRRTAHYKLVPVCVQFPNANPCGGTSRCALHASIVSNLHGVRPGAACATTTAPAAAAAAAAAPPQITPAMVLTAMRSVGLPSLTALTQPRNKTLVNFATIFYTHPRGLTTTITLLGQPVHLHATPVRYTWHYGDGTTDTTTEPGAPYPATDITHLYADAHLTVHPSVATTYTGRFQVGNRPWQDIPGTVTIPGPTTPLRIAEAVPVLSGDYS